MVFNYFRFNKFLEAPCPAGDMKKTRAAMMAMQQMHDEAIEAICPLPPEIGPRTESITFA